MGCNALNIKGARINMIMCYYTLNVKGIPGSLWIPKARGWGALYRIFQNLNEEGRVDVFKKHHSVNLKVIIQAKIINEY